MNDSATVAKVQDMVFNDYVRYIYSSTTARVAFTEPPFWLGYCGGANPSWLDVMSPYTANADHTVRDRESSASILFFCSTTTSDHVEREIGLSALTAAI